MCFGTAAFDIDTFQSAILCQNEDHPILYPVMVLVVHVQFSAKHFHSVF